MCFFSLINKYIYIYIYCETWTFDQSISIGFSVPCIHLEAHPEHHVIQFPQGSNILVFTGVWLRELSGVVEGGITPCLAIGVSFGDFSRGRLWRCIGSATRVAKVLRGRSLVSVKEVLGVREPLLPIHIGSGALCILKQRASRTFWNWCSSCHRTLRALSG